MKIYFLYTSILPTTIIIPSTTTIKSTNIPFLHLLTQPTKTTQTTKSTTQASTFTIKHTKSLAITTKPTIISTTPHTSLLNHLLNNPIHLIHHLQLLLHYILPPIHPPLLLLSNLMHLLHVH